MRKANKVLCFMAFMVLALAMSKAQQFQLLNNDFENWSGTSSTAIPSHWNTFSTANCSMSVGCSSAKTNHHYHRTGHRPGGTGNGYLTLYTKSLLGIKANGNFTNGQINIGSMTTTSTANNNKTVRSNSSYSQQFTATPDSMYFWASFYAASGTSEASVRCYIHGDFDFVDHVDVDANNSARYERKADHKFTRTTSSSTAMNWVQYKVPFEKGASTANYVLMTMSTNYVAASGAANDSLSIDDIVFIYSAWATGIDFNNTTVAGDGTFSKSNFNYVRSVEYVSDLAALSRANFNVFTEVSDVTISYDSVATTYNGRPAIQFNIHILAEDQVTQKDYHIVVYALNDDPVYYTVNTSASPSVGGSVVLNPVGPTFLSGTNVTMTATPATGYVFSRWDDNSTVNPRSLTVNSDMSFVAEFVKQTFAITVNASPTEGGSVSGGGNYEYGSLATLTATPNTGYEFVQWSDGNTNATRQVTVTSAQTYTATFQLKSYAVTVQSSNAAFGTVTGSGNYTHGSSATATATPATDYHFVRWSNNETDNPYTFTVISPVTLTAFFEMDVINYYDVTVAVAETSVGMGTVSGTANIREGYTTQISATPNTGYHFVQWTDGNTDNPRTVTVTGNVTYTATFAPNSYTITAASANPAMGTVTGGGSYDYGMSATLTAAPVDACHEFSQWSDGSTDNPRIVTVSDNASYSASFAMIQYTISATSNNEAYGSVAGSGTYDCGASVAVTATAEAGYHFVQWNDGTSVNPYVFTASQNKNIVALFAEDAVLVNYYTVTALVNDATMGSVEGAGTYEENTTATLTAQPNTGYEFVQWTDGTTANPRSFIVTEDVTYTATFQAVNYTISVSAAPADGGMVTGGGSYTYGQTADLEAVPAAGYEFVSWNDGVVLPARTITVTGNASYVATFAQQDYVINVTVNNAAFGSATGSGTYHYGDAVTATATANDGYVFIRWNNGVTDNPYTFTATQSLDLTAVFEARTVDYYNVTVLSADEAMGEAFGTGLHAGGSTVSISAVPATGYHFTQWNDGNTDNPRSVVVTSDTTFTASFAINTYTVTLSVNDAAMGMVEGAGVYEYMENVTVSAAANEGYHFVAWDNGATTETYTFPATEDVELVAVFEEDAVETYVISVISADETRGMAFGGGTFNEGDTVEIYATPNPNYAFWRWNDDNTDNPRVIVVTGNATYTAYFQFDAAIDEVPENFVIAWAEQGRLHVRGVESHTVTVTDIMGRIIYRAEACQFDTFNVQVPTFGVYLVHVDGVATHKVVVTR